ncbi:tryptophan 7-halogenase [Oscillatoria sp. CS-180]|uniref:NAD(P)/FAD-dependent oxidoreductase n=1 Tax=Oscillatoria sp. CS-180 TaxID=3021720 RepID=UPI00232E8A19|nr:tryptophan 7-halogenase [Oscillatoria sp. CS-180]MDB9524736.1 tryptophan 7-halogenase [Oscillatoria sp. CS-180]
MISVVSTPNTSSYDIAVAGAGPIGLLYASWVKLARPEARIVVIERSETPRHKIGESTLSGFCKALRSVGIRQEVLNRLFFPKNGLGFFHVDESVDNVTNAFEYILETFDETFQIERRVLESLLIANSRRLGIEVLQGARVNIKRSTFSSDGNQIVYQVQNQEAVIATKLFVDATGPASLLAKHLGLHTKTDGLFQNNAVWGYFKDVRRLDSIQNWPASAQFSRDEYTQHLCFKEGWLWYIPLVSWENVEDTQLNPLLEQLLSTTGELPTREAVQRSSDCQSEDIVSIGLVLRDDRDRVFQEQGPKAVFEQYAKQYPAIAQLLEGATFVEGHYGPQNYLCRANVRTHARQVSGDGWMIIGDAAFFVDPLISPGLTGGVAGAYFAAQESLGVVDGDQAEKRQFVHYEAFAHHLHEALERDNQLVYMSFNHPRAIELIQRFQEIDARRHFNQQNHLSDEYTLADTNVWGILSPDYQEMQQKLWQLMHETEQRVLAHCSSEQQSLTLYEEMVQQMEALLAIHLDQHVGLTPYIVQNQPALALA